MLAEAGGEPVLLGTAETAAWAVAELRRRHGPLPFQALEAAAWQQRLGEQYRDGGDAAAVVGAAESEVDLDRLMQDMPEVTDLLDAQDDAPVIRMINALLAQAARDGASDLHIEPFETHSVVRYRVDGTLRDMVQPRRALHAALVSRIKIMAHLDIAEKRLPQDGRIAIRVGGRPLDIRVSTVPTGHGERAVLRLLEKDAGRLQLQRLGMADDTLATFTGLIRQPHGIVLVTGPTGSGKTTLLKLLLGELQPAKGEVNPGTNLQIAYFDQYRAVLREDWSAIENVAEGRDFLEFNGKRKHVHAYLQDFMFTPERARAPITRLSGGERNRLLLAKLFAQPSNLLVMDEPTNDLDVETLELLEELLGEYTGTLLLVSHDRDFIDNVVTSTLVMEGDGVIGEYVGGYSDWQRYAASIAAPAAAPAAKPAAAAPAAAAATPAAPKRKLAYKG
ncbi:hypothetical protein G6F65_015630 [Rhizopus arrhizus]|nr:hypothetical protein G6F65_015630 [Rhizopus arrhizus]